MIYVGDLAKIILEKNLHNSANIIAKGYFKAIDRWIAFDNDTGDCFVEEFEEKKEAIAWIGDCFEMSEHQEFKIFKILKSLYYIPGEGFLTVRQNRENSTVTFKVWRLFQC